MKVLELHCNAAAIPLLLCAIGPFQAASSIEYVRQHKAGAACYCCVMNGQRSCFASGCELDNELSGSEMLAGSVLNWLALSHMEMANWCPAAHGPCSAAWRLSCRDSCFL
jgi:hypothetical protein